MNNYGYPLRKDQFCGNCYYSLDKREFDQFICRRKAPSPTFGDESEAYWPIVDKYFWCGEWAPQEVTR
jgi:hypothetical protein